MSTAGSIVVDLLMRTGSFETDSKRAERRLADMDKAIAKWGARIGTAVGVATTAFAGWVAYTASAGREIDKLSTLANSSATEFQRWAYGVQAVGIEKDKLADILKDVQDRVGDFMTTSGGPMADFFEQIAPKVDLTAESFRGLSGQQALGLFVQSLEKANLSQAEMIFFMEAMASDSSLLLPLLTDSAAGMRELGDEAERLGVVMSEDAVRASIDLDKNLTRLKAVIGGASTALANEAMPALSMFAEEAIEAWTQADTLDGAIASLSTDSGLREFLKGAVLGMGVLADVAVFAAKGIMVVVRAIDAGHKNAKALLALASRPLDWFADDSETAERDASYQAALNSARAANAASFAALGDVLSYEGDRNFQAGRRTAERLDFNANFIGPTQPRTRADAGGGVDRKPADIKAEQAYTKWLSQIQLEVRYQRELAGAYAQGQAAVDKLTLARDVESKVMELGNAHRSDVIRLMEAEQQARAMADASKVLADLQREIDLSGELTGAERMRYEVTKGMYSTLPKQMQDALVARAAELDAVQQQIEVERTLRAVRAEAALSERAFMREMEAYGRGDRFRGLNEALSQIDERYQRIMDDARNSPRGLSDQDRQLWEGQRDAEMERERERWLERTRMQEDWQLGALESLTNYADQSAAVYDSMGSAVTNVFQSMDQALTAFVTKGKLDFASLADSIIADMVRIAVQQSITGPLARALGSVASAYFSGSSGMPETNSWVGMDRATWSDGGYTGDGGRFEPAGVVHKGEGVLNQDEIRALGGEQGFNDLRRAIRTGHSAGGMAGRPALPPSSGGAGAAGSVTVNAYGVPGTPEVRTRRDRSGGLTVDLLWKQLQGQMVAEINQGQGPMVKSIERRYALTPKLGG